LSRKAIIPCPECKFPNTQGALRCLGCGERLGRGDETTSQRDPRFTASHGIEVDLEFPPDPPTSRVRSPQAGIEAVGWLCCDPLPPIPLASGASVTIGRSADCDLVLPNTGVSRRHAVITADEQAIRVTDRSSNGTLLNGKRVQAAALRVGDVLTLGPYDLEVRRSVDLDGDEPSGEQTQPLEFSSISTGTLAEVPISQTLQESEFTGKSGVLKVISGDLRGSVFLGDGEPVSATLGDLRDDEALLAMLELREGRFVFSLGATEVERTMTRSVTALLLEHSRRADDRARGT